MQRPILTFIHGFMGHPSDWDDVRAALPEFETSALEVRPALDWQSTVAQLADQILEPSVVIGYSMGARLALGIALEHDQKCAGLGLVSGNPGLETKEAREQRWASDQQIAFQLQRLDEESVSTFLSQWYKADVFATVPAEIRQAEIARKRERFSTDWAKVLQACSVARQPDYWPRLQQLSIPTNFIAGELDEKYRSIAVRFASEANSVHVSKKIVPNCGHIVHREQPDVLVQAIRDLGL
jgi:2-succinyl-6-hydroxy-2,4-cyclohexadiene-1-carboxylate synthase